MIAHRTLGRAIVLAGLAMAGGLSPAVSMEAGRPGTFLVAANDGGDEQAWALIRDASDPLVFQNFIVQFPKSAHVADARAKLAALLDEGQSVPAPSAAPTAPTPADVVAAVQSELHRAGCYAGPADGDWGSASRIALAAFAAGARLDVAGSAPDAGLLATLKSKPGTICKSSPTVAQAPTPAPVGGCFDVHVTVDELTPSGTKWDPWPGKLGIVDPIVTETTTGATNSCGDSYTCSVRVNASTRMLSFKIMDSDPDEDDFIGAGSCPAGGTCRLGSAVVSMSRC